jgi:hypothetical protein
MTYHSRKDWLVYAGILVAAAALYLHVGYWIAGPVLLILVLCAYPQSYELVDGELIVNDSLTRRRIPYRAIASARRDGSDVRVVYGHGSELVISPADPQAFVDSLARLMPRDRYVEYTLGPTRGAVGRREPHV